MAAKFELFKGSNGDYRWRLKSANGQVIASSGESFSSKSGALNGVEAVKKAAADARVDEVDS